MTRSLPATPRPSIRGGARALLLASAGLVFAVASHGQGTPGVSMPGAPTPTTKPLPTPVQPTVQPKPLPTVQPPTRPLDPTPIKPKTATAPICLPASGPTSITASISPTTVRNGVPVTMTARTLCPVTSNQPVLFAPSAPGVFDRASGETLAAFATQFPRAAISAGSNTVSVTFTPTGLGASFNGELKARIEGPPALLSGPTGFSIVGNGSTTPPPPPPPPTNGGGTVTCRPTLTMNAVETAVTAGALVHVDLTLSCALPGPAQVQIISNRPNLVVPPPGGIVTMAAGATTMRVELDSSRTESGTSTLRAMLSNPAGNLTAGDDVQVVR